MQPTPTTQPQIGQPLHQVLHFDIKRIRPRQSCEAGRCPYAATHRVEARAPDGTTVTHRYCDKHTPSLDNLRG